MYCIDELIPHSGKMSLLDRVVAYGEDWLTTSVTICSNSMFCENNAVPALVGIEYMAQTIAAFAGKNDKINNIEISIGLLIGARKYTTNVTHFPVGTTLQINAQQIYLEEQGLGVFKCKITGDSGILVEANLNVYHPEDIESIIK
ncbi:3-hydroxydecanoyl-[ACP] dehydratase [hydrothermal vent metagenome]|uniref:3-hydroxydecanoyl-[ACP] dehydratase n=1 Tax=hydrothermal vent metagenome TaxID=652676 RepID=A0A3B0VA52_9ZZZZ